MNICDDNVLSSKKTAKNNLQRYLALTRTNLMIVLFVQIANLKKKTFARLVFLRIFLNKNIDSRA